MERLSIIGCGTMGSSIALSAAWAGITVKLYGINPAEINKAVAAIREKTDILLENELVNIQSAADIQQRVQTTVSLDELIDDATFIIETVPEDLQLKQRLFADLDQKCNKSVILATNTSALSPSAIASEMQHPERLIVTHFCNPAHLVPLVEVVKTQHTSDDVVSRTFALLAAMHKKPIMVRKEAPGFVLNRLQFALFREAQHILDQGIATKEDIDAAVTYGIGRRLPITGPLLSADMGGLDVFKAVSDNLFGNLSNAQQSLPALQELVAANKLGTKNGEGFYKWDESFTQRMNKARENELIRFLKNTPS